MLDQLLKELLNRAQGEPAKEDFDSLIEGAKERILRDLKDPDRSVESKILTLKMKIAEGELIEFSEAERLKEKQRQAAEGSKFLAFLREELKKLEQ